MKVFIILVFIAGAAFFFVPGMWKAFVIMLGLAGVLLGASILAALVGVVYDLCRMKRFIKNGRH